MNYLFVFTRAARKSSGNIKLITKFQSKPVPFCSNSKFSTYRLGRSLKHLLERTSDLKKREIGLASIHDHMDTTTAQGRLIFNNFASLAEFERIGEPT
jgi:hypothetical protein